MAACPLRFVLGDDLTRASAELAFADGARLVGCLDLLRMPAPHMWIEWNDETHKRVIHETQSAAEFDAAAMGRKVGMLLQASANGLTAVGRTFWADAADDECADVTLSPLETHIDLRVSSRMSCTRTMSCQAGSLMSRTEAIRQRRRCWTI